MVTIGMNIRVTGKDPFITNNVFQAIYCCIKMLLTDARGQYGHENFLALFCFLIY